MDQPRLGRRAGAALSACVTALLLLVTGCGPRLEREAPAELLGRWTTAHPSYVDRSLRIDSEAIAFGVGGGREELHPLEGVERLEASRSAASFRLYYRDPAGTRELLDLELRLGPRAVLRLPHIDADWVRSDPAPAG